MSENRGETLYIARWLSERKVAYCQGTPLRNEIEERDADLLDHVTDRATEAIAERFGSGRVSAKILGHIITATR